MRKFDMIIGYSAVKKELKQIADTLKNQEYYKKLLTAADIQEIKNSCKIVPVAL